MTPPRVDSRLFAASPSVLTAAVLLLYLAEFTAPVSDLWRPLTIGIAVAVLIQTAASVALRSIWRGTYVAALCMSLLLGVWPAAGILLVLPIWLWTANAGRRRRSSRSRLLSIEPALRFGAIAATLFLVVSMLRVAVAFGPWNEPPPAEPVSLPGSGGPDIFVLLLDGYPRADELDAAFGIDNQPFLSALERHGFAVDRSARSSYMKTWLTLASLLHMRPVDEIAAFHDPPGDPAAQYRYATRVIQQAPFADALRGRGYSVTANVSSFTETALMTADRVVETGHPTNLENHILQSIPIGHLVERLSPGILARLHVEQVAEGIDQVKAAARDVSGEPLFMLGHVMAPHAPFSVDEAGNAVPLPDCFPGSCLAFGHYVDTLGMDRDEFGRRLAGYLEYTNGLVLDAVRQIVEERPEAVILVMSDHGLRFDRSNVNEHFHTLFAARTPGAEDVFPPGTGTANVFRHLSNAYFGTSFEEVPYQAWFSDGRLLDLVAVTVD